MAKINELAKMCYGEVVEIVTGNEYQTEIQKIGALLAVCEQFDMECSRI